MSNAILFTAVMAVLLSGIFVTPAFAQSVQITVETDKENYNPGDTISISGTVNSLITGSPITLQFKSANGLISVGQVSPEEDQTWSHQIKLSTTAKAGEYTISVLYGNFKDSTTLTVGQGLAQISPPSSTTPPIISETVEAKTTYSLDGDSIEYKITGGSITSIYPQPQSNSLIIEIDATDDGMLTISLPRAVIDSSGEGPLNGEFFVLVDGEEFEFSETEQTDTYRTLEIEFYAGSEEIEIIGTMVIPEFGVVAIMVLAIAITSIVVITSKSRLSQITGL